MFPSHPSTLPKINLIELPLLVLDEKGLEKSTKIALSHMLPQSDYLKILFIGDNSIRTLYQDVIKALKYGRLLDYIEDRGFPSKWQLYLHER